MSSTELTQSSTVSEYDLADYYVRIGRIRQDPVLIARDDLRTFYANFVIGRVGGADRLGAPTCLVCHNTRDSCGCAFMHLVREKVNKDWLLTLTSDDLQRVREPLRDHILGWIEYLKTQHAS